MQDAWPRDDFPALMARLEATPLVRQIWPDEEPLGLFDWLERADPPRAAAARDAFEFARAFGAFPILAVAGGLASGKSSLVSSFLALENRPRVLVGDTRSQGSNRLTLWAPSAWRDEPGFEARLRGLLESVFDAAAEDLALDPAAAHAQQNAALLEVPLLAFDAALDAHGLALMDCPDVQRAEEGEVEGENRRLDVVARAAGICSGVALVSSRSQVSIRDLAAITRRLPRATRIFAINQIRVEEPADVLAEARDALDTGDAPVFGAFDFDVERNRHLRPTWAEERQVAFFRIDPDPARNTPAAVDPERALQRLTHQLDAGDLRSARQREAWRDLGRDVAGALADLGGAVEARWREVERALTALDDQLRMVFYRDGLPAIQMDARVADSLAESFSRTAPFYLKPFIYVRRRALGPITRAPAEALRLLRESMNAGDALAERAEAMKRDLQSGSTTPLEMAQHLSVWSSAVGAYRDRDAWRADAEQILQRMREEERSNLEPEQWDDLTRAIWAEAPKLRANLTVVGALLAAIVTMALLPLDPTGTLWAVTLKELLGVIGAGGAMAAVSEKQLERGNFQVLAQRQFESLLAIACDQVGLPRASDEAALRDVPTRLNRESLGVAKMGWRLLEIEGDALAQAADAAEDYTS